MINSNTIIFIHDYLTNYFVNLEDPIQPPGVKSQNGIESAASRPDLNPEYDTSYLKAAALFHSIINNHPFHNGNKRTALLSTIYYLGELGILLERCSDDELYEFTRQIAAHEICENRNDEVSVIAEFLETNSRHQSKGDRPLKFNRLKSILANFNYGLLDYGAVYKIRNLRTNSVIQGVTVKKKGQKGREDFDPQYISKLRKLLNLTPEHGIDSMRFYGEEGISEDLSEFMKFRLEVMKKLAKI
ncbi:death-on-curing family protein [Neisseria chenwenguii]|uniref:Death-on-curing family protein n=1 Tax=Neisseria chenwenguii TaxID=1853278 RepID=A0A220S495_9NEIS|nr:Fic family protein [Neisseria chenwenguii]ASK28349.1 death-on-curing family protein [Neisseria chenwenguii]